MKQHHLIPKAPLYINSSHVRVLDVQLVGNLHCILRGRGQCSSIKCGQGIGKQTSETTRVGIT